uniref:Glycosylated lysosomal membrane protein n=1 Tax=Varanus komodoensis TaxID=61221 RepID=A0A8D2JBH1_VARKO
MQPLNATLWVWQSSWGRTPSFHFVYLEYNPGWNSSAGNLLHVRAVGLEDTIHYIWSTIGAPTVLLVYTGSTNSALHVNWTALLSPSPSGAIRVEPATSILYSTAVIFPKVTAYKESGRDASLPRLLHTANSSKVEFVMSGVSPRGNHSRFALEVVTVEERGWRRQLRAVSSIDDEYSPTIFEVALRARPVSPGFLQWKTAAYSSRHAERIDTVQCRYYPLRTANRTVPRPSIALAYFGQELERDHAVAAVNISFGSEDDEAYQEKGYLSWSALIGFGEPPMDSFSPLVIAILAVALGAPVVLLVVGSLAVLAVGNKRHSEYEPIN